MRVVRGSPPSRQMANTHRTPLRRLQGRERFIELLEEVILRKFSISIPRLLVATVMRLSGSEDTMW